MYPWWEELYPTHACNHGAMALCSYCHTGCHDVAFYCRAQRSGARLGKRDVPIKGVMRDVARRRDVSRSDAGNYITQS